VDQSNSRGITLQIGVPAWAEFTNPQHRYGNFKHMCATYLYGNEPNTPLNDQNYSLIQYCLILSSYYLILYYNSHINTPLFICIYCFVCYPVRVYAYVHNMGGGSDVGKL
jgi:hypothetical protein